MDFRPKVELSDAETARIRDMSERYLGSNNVRPFIKEVRAALRKAAKGHRVRIVDFTTSADRMAPRIQLGVVIDGRPSHGMIFGLNGKPAGVSLDN